MRSFGSGAECASLVYSGTSETRGTHRSAGDALSGAPHGAAGVLSAESVRNKRSTFLSAHSEASARTLSASSFYILLARWTDFQVRSRMHGSVLGLHPRHNHGSQTATSEALNGHMDISARYALSTGAFDRSPGDAPLTTLTRIRLSPSMTHCWSGITAHRTRIRCIHTR